MWIVAGLGNPGPEYAGTRHNVGFLVAEALAARDPRARWARRGPALLAETRQGDVPLLLIKPQTFMNRSGLALAALLAALPAPPAGLVVIHDEVDLPYGTLRLKVGGGHGGHNGLRSIAQELASRDFLRVRVGIGRPPEGAEMTDWVLGAWDPEARAALPDLLTRAVEATLTLVAEGFTAAANRFNVRPGRPETATAAGAGPTPTAKADEERPTGTGRPPDGTDQDSR